MALVLAWLVAPGGRLMLLVTMAVVCTHIYPPPSHGGSASGECDDRDRAACG
jgi:hypothetical protein